MENKKKSKAESDYYKNLIEQIAVNQILSLGKCVRQVQDIKSNDNGIELNLNILGMWVKYKLSYSKTGNEIADLTTHSISYEHIPGKIITTGFENYRKHLMDLNLISLN
jgi:hypothetical protein